MKNASRWMDVYQEPPNHIREEARVRLLEAWYVPICSLFNGRLIDKPETPMPETPETSGGEVEHEVFLFSNLILLVIEMKFAFKNARDYYAQVLLELVSAMKLNRDRDLDPQPPIYAMLSDLHDFYFFSYDGTKFQRMVEITIPQQPRAQFMEGMAQVSDLLFSLLLNGYIEILAAVEKRSTKRGSDGDVSTHNSFSPGKPVIGKVAKQVPRPSLDSWSKAHLKAREAQSILIKPDLASEDTWEKDGRCGMNVLNESLKYLLKIGSLADWDEDDSNLEIGGVMDQVIQAQRKRFKLTGTK